MGAEGRERGERWPKVCQMHATNMEMHVFAGPFATLKPDTQMRPSKASTHPNPTP